MNAAHATAAPKKRQSRLVTPPANALTYRVDDGAALLGASAACRFTASSARESSAPSKSQGER
jgi:hypothetical protein